MKRLSQPMQRVMDILGSSPEAYVRETIDGYEIGCSRVRVYGMYVTPRVSRATLRALLTRNLLVHGRRMNYGRQQVGYFPASSGDVVSSGKEGSV